MSAARPPLRPTHPTHAEPGWGLGDRASPSQAQPALPLPTSVPPPSISSRVSWLAVKATFLGLLGYGLYWMGRRASSLVLSLPAAQYCLQRASEAGPHK